NDSRTFGVLLQVFAENRHLERQGQELLGYSQILPTSPLASTHPDLANVYYPDLIGSTLFQQKRERTGGMVDIQWAPNDQVDLDLSGFNSKLDATDLNTNYLLFNSNVINGGAGQKPTVPAGSTLAQVCAANPGKYNGCAPGLGLEPGYVVQGSTLTRAAFTPYSSTSYGVYDQISRPDEGASTNFVNLDAHLKASDQLSFLGQLGLTTGHSRTPTQDVSETLPGFGNGAAYQLNGTATAANWNLGTNTLNTTPTPNGVPVPFSFIFGDQNVDTVDREVYGKIDGDFKANAGVFKELKFGARYADHERNLWGVIGQGPTAFGSNPLNYPTGFQNYPTNFGNGLGTGFPTGIWYWTPAQLAAYNLQGANRNPITRADWTSDYGLEEKDTAGYVQADFGGTGWSGNIGVRAVQTKERVIQNVAASPTNPNAITTSAFGPYVQQTTDNTYTDVLPTANLKLDVTHDLVARFAAGQSMSRPDWSALANSIALGAPPPRDATVPGSATGSNPNLKPIKSTNADAGLEWYYAPRALLAGTVFYMDLKNYVTFGSYLQYFTQFDKLGAYQAPYLVTAPVNADGRVYGAEFQWQQPLGEHFGIQTNYTYADGRQTSGVAPGFTDQLLGTSKSTYNVIGWFETSRYFARVAYTYRSAFYSGLDRSTAFSQDAFGTLGASLGFTVNDNFQITLDGLNLNNPTYKYFALNQYQPRAFYKNGSQYYLNFRFKL
ncbi:MAG: TonB-dependent receptor, partial [Acidimicrobiaceae bacterium]|nr:TonB-dependent receptor [Acidimicrobiaceae bacterium]